MAEAPRFRSPLAIIQAREHPKPIERALVALLLLLSTLAAGGFAWSAAQRIVHPYEIEWLESELLQHIERVNTGLPLYQAPTLEFAPTIYPPVYAWTAAAAERLMGISSRDRRFAALRLVSAISTLLIALSAAIIAGVVGDHWLGGVTAAAMILSAQVACGMTLDLARLDPLWVLLLVAACTLTARAERGLGWAVAGGLAFAVATLTKQPTVLFAGAMGADLFFANRRHALAFAAAWLLPAATAYGWLHWQTGGWSTIYLALIPLRVEHQAGNALHFLRDDVLRGAAPALAIAALWAMAPKASRPGGALPRPWVIAAIAAAVATSLMRTLQGGGLNTLVPLVVFGAITTGMIGARVLRHGSETLRHALLLALVLQLGMHCYNPKNLVPTEADRGRSEALVQRITDLGDDVWIPSHTSYAVLAGQAFKVHRDPLLDLQYSGWDGPPTDLLAALREGRFDAIILDAAFVEPELQQALESGYGQSATIDDPPAPLTGFRTLPSQIWMPR